MRLSFALTQAGADGLLYEMVIGGTAEVVFLFIIFSNLSMIAILT
jgi:hypothetical protein